MSTPRHGIASEAMGRRIYDKEAQRRKRVATLLERYGTAQGGIHLSQIRMIVTPWFLDPADGLKTRIVRAAE